MLTSCPIFCILIKQVTGAVKTLENLFDYGILAQLGEHLPYKQRVIGSSPIGPIYFGEIAQLARAHGSYPWCRGFKSPSRYYVKYSGNALLGDFRCFFKSMEELRKDGTSIADIQVF